MFRGGDLPGQNESFCLAERRQILLEHYSVLDIAADEALERLTRLAGTVFGVPTALISLIGRDWQWLKACYGFDADGVDPEISFCVHAI